MLIINDALSSYNPRRPKPFENNIPYYGASTITKKFLIFEQNCDVGSLCVEWGLPTCDPFGYVLQQERPRFPSTHEPFGWKARWFGTKL
jgi:hypothetical protein